MQARYHRVAVRGSISVGMMAMALLLPAVGRSEVCGFGLELTANEYWTLDQASPSVAALADGAFLVTWHSRGSFGDDTDDRSIQARRYTANGTPIDGVEFQVNTDTTGRQYYTAVTAQGDDGFVVVWNHNPAAPQQELDLRAQRFALDATPSGGEFEINSFTPDDQILAKVGADADGDFVVTWSSRSSAGSDTSGLSIQARRFTADGVPKGADFQVNSSTAGDQWFSDVAVAPGGEFVVVWMNTNPGSDGSGSSIRAQLFAADGDPEGPELQVNSFTPNDQRAPRVASFPGGGFLVSWNSWASAGSDTDQSSVQARRFSASGFPMGPDFQVNSYTTDSQVAPTIAVDADGSFVVTFTTLFPSPAGDSDVSSVLARGFDASGVPRGPDRQVNLKEIGAQEFSAIAMRGDGGVLIAWNSELSPDDPDDFGVSLRRFHNRPLLCDGFESGDTSAWSVTVP